MAIGIPPEEIQKKIFCNPLDSDVIKNLGTLSSFISSEEILEIQENILHIHCDPDIAQKYILFAEWTRNPHVFRYGLSLRSISLLSLAIRANAFLEGRDFVIPEDGKDLIIPFCQHRIENINESKHTRF